MGAGVIHDVAYVITEVRRALSSFAQLTNHGVCYIRLKLAVLNAAGVAHHIDDPFSRIGNVLGHIFKTFAEVIVIRRQAQRLWQGLIPVLQWEMGFNGLRLHSAEKLQRFSLYTQYSKN